MRRRRDDKQRPPSFLDIKGAITRAKRAQVRRMTTSGSSAAQAARPSTNARNSSLTIPPPLIFHPSPPQTTSLGGEV
jgi:hypothetical protein